MQEKRYKDYALEDFLADESFRAWVLCNSQEMNDFWGKWMENHPGKKAILLQAKEIISALYFPVYEPGDIDENEVLDKIILEDYSNRHHADEFLVYEQMKAHHRKLERWTWFKAAAVLSAISLSIVFYIFKNQPEPVAQSLIVNWTWKENNFDQRSVVRLPDGSHVILNVNSRIHYPDTFAFENRMVELEGEAFFDVAEDIHKPFIVKTKNLYTEALGTSFNIRNSDKHREIEIALVSGKVRVSGDATSKETILAPGDKVNYNQKSQKLQKSAFNLEEVTGWKEGLLLFKNDNYNTLVKKLEHWYGVEVSLLNRPPESWEINGRFVNQNLHDVLTRLEYTHGIEFKIVKNKVEIKF
ncbi:MAG: FecR domain-containing protein [Cyclobacteriaceae bacterium]|nr:FecR domain-containing protein [Cyclobacteriaceae bacterium]